MQRMQAPQCWHPDHRAPAPLVEVMVCASVLCGHSSQSLVSQQEWTPGGTTATGAVDDSENTTSGWVVLDPEILSRGSQLYVIIQFSDNFSKLISVISGITDSDEKPD